LATMVMVDSGKYQYIDDYVFNPYGLAYSIGVLFSSIVTSVLLRVISNISKNLFEIKADIKEFKFVYIEKED